MTDHAAVGERAAQLFASEVRAEMARQKLTANELAAVLGVTAHTAGARLNGRVPFNVLELATVADWLGIDLAELVSRTQPSKAAA